MTATTDFATALQGYTLIRDAMTAWSNNVTTAMPRPIYEAGWEAMASAENKAIDAVASARADTFPDIAAKASFIANLPDFADVTDPWAMAAVKALADDLERIAQRSANDEFAGLLAAYENAISAREIFEQANRPKDTSSLTPEMEAFEDACIPFHDACSAAALAVVTCPAPDMAALVQKQRIFHSQQMHHCSETSRQAIAVLFADAIRFAGGAA